MLDISWPVCRGISPLLRVLISTSHLGLRHFCLVALGFQVVQRRHACVKVLGIGSLFSGWTSIESTSTRSVDERKEKERQASPPIHPPHFPAPLLIPSHDLRTPFSDRQIPDLITSRHHLTISPHLCHARTRQKQAKQATN